MLEKTIAINKSKNLIQNAQNQFQQWLFKDMGELRKFPHARHLHISSKNKLEKGTFEVTIFEDEKNFQILLKLTSNRKGNWAESAMNIFEKYLYET